MAKLKYDILEILTKEECRYIQKVEALPLKDKKKIEFDSNGNVKGITNYQFKNPNVNKIHTYMNNKVENMLMQHLKTILKPADIRPALNKIKTMGLIVGSYGFGETFRNVMGGIATGSTFLVSCILGCNSLSDFNLVCAGICDRVLDAVQNDVMNIFDNLIDNITDALGISELFNFIDNLGMSRYGDIIPNRPVYVISLYNGLTREIYKMCRINSNDMSFSTNIDIETQNVIGRTGPMVAYNNSDTTFSIDYTMHQDLLIDGNVDRNLKVLRNMANPKYVGNIIKYPKIKVIINNRKYLCVCTSYTENERTDILDKRGKPVMYTVSMGFTILTKMNKTLIQSNSY